VIARERRGLVLWWPLFPWRLASSALRRVLADSLFRRRQLDPGAASFGKPDGNGLLGRARPVLALADVFHGLVDEFTGLPWLVLSPHAWPAALFGLSFFQAWFRASQKTCGWIVCRSLQ
jgi:hypothetical protein